MNRLFARSIQSVWMGLLLAVTGPLVAQQPFDYSTQAGYDAATGRGTLGADGHFVSSNPGGFSGVYVNNFLGANRFYAAGFTGTQATVANIEAGLVAGNVSGIGGAQSPGYAGGHETLRNVNTFFASTANPFNDATLVDRHATWVGNAMYGSGSQNYQQGIAYGANSLSGAVANTWVGATGWRNSFNFSYQTFIEPYRAAMLNDVSIRVNGTAGSLARTADVINSSWGFGDPTGSAFGDFSRGIDALAAASKKAVVFSAGNSGSGSNTVGGPASGYNVISVGALASDTTNPVYNTVSTFSSRGPMQVFVPKIANVTNINDAAQGTIINAARGRVDISAPGQNLTLAYYGGATGGNQAPSEAGTPNGGSNFYSFNTAGTSFAAPTVAGGLGLIVDAGRTMMPANTEAIDGRVLKAALLNSADKTSGWTNQFTGRGVVGSVYNTSQGLDYTVGAGRMNLGRAFDQYLNGTTGLAGLGGGTVGKVGWDLGFASQTTQTVDYFIDTSVSSGQWATGTLSWFVERSIDATNATLEQRFDNLDLLLYKVDSVGGAILDQNLVARSNSIFDTTEHFYFVMPETGFYALRVQWAGTNWNFTGTTGSQYGLAWSFTAVPEPSTLVLSAVAFAAFTVIRRRGSYSR